MNAKDTKKLGLNALDNVVYTREEFLKQKFAYSVYDEVITEGFKRKGYAKYIAWAIEGLLKHFSLTISTKYLKQFIDTTEEIEEIKAIKESLLLKVFKSSLTTIEERNLKLSFKYDLKPSVESFKAMFETDDEEEQKNLYYINEENLKFYGISLKNYKLVKKWFSVSQELKVLRVAQTKKISYIVAEFGLKTSHTSRAYKKEVFEKQRKVKTNYSYGFNKNIIEESENFTTGEKKFKNMTEIIFLISLK